MAQISFYDICTEIEKSSCKFCSALSMLLFTINSENGIFTLFVSIFQNYLLVFASCYNTCHRLLAAGYIKILQVLVPFVATLTQLVFGADVTTGNLKKGLKAMGEFTTTIVQDIGEGQGVGGLGARGIGCGREYWMKEEDSLRRRGRFREKDGLGKWTVWRSGSKVWERR